MLLQKNDCNELYPSNFIWYLFAKQFFCTNKGAKATHAIFRT